MPAVQQSIANIAVNKLKKDLNVDIQLEGITINFPTQLALLGLYVEDQQQDSLLYCGELGVDIAFYDLLNNSINIEEVEIDDLLVNVYRQKADQKFNYEFILENFTSSDTTTQAPADTTAAPWEYNLGEFDLENIRLRYDDDSTKSNFHVDLGRLFAGFETFDLENSKIELDEVSLINSFIKAELFTDTTAVPDTSSSVVTLDIGWQIAVNSLQLENDRVIYNDVAIADTSQTTDTLPAFNPARLDFKNIALEINDFELNGEKAQCTLTNLHIEEQSGLAINNAASEILVGEMSKASLTDFLIETPNSKLTLDLDLNYETLNQLASHYEQTQIDLQLKEFKPGLEDALFFVPQLDTAISKKGVNSISLSGDLKGKLAQTLQLDNLNLRSGDSTLIQVNGEVKYPLSTDSMEFAINLDTLISTRQDLLSFLPDVSKPTGINLPTQIFATANASGSLSKAKAEVNLNTNMGGMQTTLNYRSDDSTHHFAQGEIDVKQFQIGSFLQNPSLDKLTASLDFKVNINDNAITDMQSTAVMDTFYFNGYNYANIDLKADMINDSLSYNANLDDKNLKFKLDGSSVLADLQKHHIQLNLDKLDLVKLNMSDSVTDVSGILKANASLTDVNDLNAELLISNLRFRRAGLENKVGELKAKLFQTTDSLKFVTKTELLDALIESNLNISEIYPEMESYLSQYVYMDDVEMDSIDNHYFHIDLQTKDSPLWYDLLIPSMNYMGAISLKGNYNDRKKNLDIFLKTDSVNYAGIVVDTLNFRVNGNKNKLSAGIRADKIESSLVYLSSPVIDLNFANDTAAVELAFRDSLRNPFFLIKSEISRKDSSFYVHLDSDRLLLLGKKWNIDRDNYVSIEKNSFLRTHNFRLSNGQQMLSVTQDSTSNRYDNLKIAFQNFQLENLINLIDAKQTYAKGEIEGEVLLADILTELKFDVGLDIEKLEMFEVPFGNLKLDVNNKNPDFYDVAVNLEGDKNEMALDGRYYVAGPDSSKIALNADIDYLDLSIAGDASGGELKNVTGYLDGSLDINGTAAKPEITGNLDFNDFEFLLTYLNTKFKIDDEGIQFQKDGIYLNSFTLVDENNNEASIDGSIKDLDFMDYVLDLKIKANQFQALNTKQGENDMYFGKVLLNTDIDVEGSILSPTVDMNLELLKGTDVTYIVPEDELVIEEQKGIVEFVQVNRTDTLELIDLDADSVSQQAQLTGIDINMNIRINPDTKLNVLIDEKAGDKLEITGSGDLVLNIQRSGNMTLTGRYDINGGSYSLSFYGLVSKKFSLADGSYVLWKGDPFNADIDIQALYETRTSPESLMSSIGEDGSQYQKPQLFQVKMNIDGDLERPLISFEMDIPENARSNGTVYDAVQQLNQTESELNKQVFALLVLNSFISTSSNGNEIGDNLVSSTARSSVSKLLTNQLNNLTDKYIKGVQLNLNLESYGSGNSAGTDLQVGLSKSLLDERVTVEVGGSYQLEGEQQQQSDGVNNLVGNVAIEYKITKDGRYRLRFYQMNEYEGILDGQITSTGLSIIFTRDYDKLKNLFKKEKNE
ncbi:translocation/assembly module TamB domain-containing protein [Chondrinema litorale]|uniref:translocation/assembly module TamB domain-containing protein n=1 Tax=Chondrinema litorale TaxID=2994555 RepID=UPI00254382CC|nr:translocation/assembly module TamB [Chondrinema litorale]UZR97071.1 translocation/assembly module TamB domain-containing protein [Chondrinema litorale]